MVTFYLLSCPLVLFCLYRVALNIYCASNMWTDTCDSRCLVLQLQSTELSRKVTNSFEWSWTISEC